MEGNDKDIWKARREWVREMEKQERRERLERKKKGKQGKDRE